MMGSDDSNQSIKSTNGQFHTRAFLCQYDQNKLNMTNLPMNLDAIKSQISQTENNWIHISGLNNVDFIKSLCQGFDVHALVTEDIINTKQRVKAEDYNHYLFVVLRALKQLSSSQKIEYEQVSFILMPKLLISFTSQPLKLFDFIHARLQRQNSRIRSLGVDYLLYAMMDTLVDEYMRVTEKKGDILAKLESKMIRNPGGTSLSKLYSFRRELLYLRRHVQSFRDLVSSLYKTQCSSEHIITAEPYQGVISSVLTNYFQDLYDHTVRTLEAVDLFRDLSKEMLDLYINTVNHKMNERINILTIFSTIFIPLTFITGVFGMNFRVIPGLNSSVGFFVIMAMMLILSIALLIIFKLRKWF